MQIPTRTRPAFPKRRRSASIEILESRIAPANAYGVDQSGTSLIHFDTSTPNTLDAPVLITGLHGGESIVALDFRPADGLLYGLGSASDLYVINAHTAVATQVGSAGAFTLSGTNFGFDFNAITDQLSVVSDSGQNLLINPNTGALVVPANTLAYAAGDPHAGATPSVIDLAYSNNFVGAAGTTLYGIDSTLHTLVKEDSTTGILTTVGALGINLGPASGFDIFGNTAFLVGRVSMVTSLYSVDLTTGSATSLGTLGSGSSPIKALAVSGAFTSSTGVDGNGPFATFTGTAGGATLIVTEGVFNGATVLQNNRFAAGDPGYNSAFDFDSTQPGDQLLPYVANGINSRVDVTSNGGHDFYSITRTGVFTPGAVNMPGGTAHFTIASGTGVTLAVSTPITADHVTLTSDNVQIVSPINAAVDVTISGFQAGRAILLQETSGSGVSLAKSELNNIHTPLLTLGRSDSGQIQINENVTINSSTLHLITGAGVSTSFGSLTVTSLAVQAGGDVNFGVDSSAISNVAVSTSGGGFTIRDSLPLTVTTVDGVSGLSTTGDISLTIKTAAPNVLLNITQPVTTNGSGDITFGFDNVTLGATVDASGHRVTIEPFSSGQKVNLGGADGAGTLGLSLTEVALITADTLQIGNSTSGDITISDALSLTNVTTLSLQTGGGIAETSAPNVATVSVANLALHAVNAVTLTNTNDVTTLAVKVTGDGQGFSFTNAHQLSIGNVDGVSGIATSNGAINVNTINGDLSVGHVTVFSGAATINLTAGGLDSEFSNSTGLVEAGDQNITISADRMDLGSASYGIFAGDGIVSLDVTSTSRDIHLGSTSDPTGTLDLSDAELGTIDASIVRIGDTASIAHNITLTDAISARSGFDTLSLFTNTGDISQAAGASLTIASLLVIATGTITLGDPGNTVSTLAAGGVQGLTFVNSTSLTLGSVDTGIESLVSGGAFTGGATSLGNIQITAGGAGSLLTVSDPISSRFVGFGPGNITLSADDMAINAAIDAGTATVQLEPGTAGRSIDLGLGTTPGALGLSLAELNQVTAGALRISNSTAGNLTVSDVITGTWSTLSLLTGASVSESGAGAITVTNLAVQAGSGINLGINVSAVSNVAAISSPSGGFSLLDSSPLAVTIVDGVFGINTAGDVHLKSSAPNTGLDVILPVTTNGAGDVTFVFDNIAPQANINADGHRVTLEPFSAGQHILLGGPGGLGTLGRLQINLTTITADTLQIGNSASGDLTVAAAITVPGMTTLDLETGGAIINGAGGSVTVPDLALHAGTGIGDAAPLDVVGPINVAFDNSTSGKVQISSIGTLTIDSVDGLLTSANHGTTTTLSATAGAGPSPGGIIFAADTLSHGTLTATAVESAQPSDDVRVKVLVNVTSETGDILFSAGDGIFLENDSVLNAANQVHLSFGAGNVDGISFINLQGFISGQLLALQGGTGHESITVADFGKIHVNVLDIHTGVDNVPDNVTLIADDLPHTIVASPQAGGYISVLGFPELVRIFDTTIADTLTIQGGASNDVITATPGVENAVHVVLDGGGGDDVLTGTGVLVGGDGNDTLNAGTGNSVMLGDGGAGFLYGLIGNDLVHMLPNAPRTVLGVVPVTGLAAGETLVDIAVRPSNGTLYAIGDNAGSAHLSTIDPTTAAAPMVAALSSPLSSTGCDLAFDPVGDQLHVVSNTGDQVSVDPATGVVTAEESDPGVRLRLPYLAVAYTNSYAGAAGATLYGIDPRAGNLVIENYANGILTTVGSLGVPVSAVLGFDIVPGTGTAYASLDVGGVDGLYTIDLFNGVATLVGALGGASAVVHGLAIGATHGNNVLSGGAGDDLLVGGSGNNTLSGGGGHNTVLGGQGFNVLHETRNADFTLSDTGLAISDGSSDSFHGIQQVALTGGAGANHFNVGACTGNLAITGAGGSDTLDYSAAAQGVRINLDLSGTPQLLNSTGASVTLGDVMPNFTGSDFNDTIFAGVQSFARTIDGGAPSVAPGDHLTVDGHGAAVTVTKLSANSGTIKAPNFGTIGFTDIESISTVNSSSNAGFGSPGSGFNAPVIYKVGAKPTQVVTGDLNGDGFDDVVTVNSGAKTISVLLSNGDGTFAPAVTYKTGGRTPQSIVLANIDDNSSIAGGDQDLDIIVSNKGSNSVSVLLNDGTGALGTPTLFKTAAAPTVLHTGDFNGDGLLDIAALSKSGAMISVLLNTGGGAADTASFGTATRIRAAGKAAVASDFVVGNFDGDPNGDLDLAVVLPGSSSLAVLTGDGSGNFTPSATKYGAGTHPTVVAIADFNNDGIPDLAVSHSASQAISILLGRGNAGGDLFLPRLTTTFAFGAIDSMIAGDFNGDGNADLAFAATSGGALKIALGTGSDSFQPALRFPILSVPSDLGVPGQSTDLAIGDFNGDGAPDFVVSNRLAGSITVQIRTPGA